MKDEALKQALAAPVQEPVAVVSVNTLTKMFQNTNTDPSQWGHHWAKGWNAALSQAMDYATPPEAQRQWVGLTDEEANQLWESTDSDWELMKRTEAKLKEKNT